MAESAGVKTRNAKQDLQPLADRQDSDGNSKWLDAFNDPLATIYSFTHCMCLDDLHADGEYKLIIADLGTGRYDMKLKVYKGTSLMSENTIIDLPTGVVTFHIDLNEPRVPAIAVASGSYIYVYKNLRPYFKFTLPPLPINLNEREVWEQAKQDSIDIVTMKEMLEGIRFLMLSKDEMVHFVQLHKHAPLKRQTVITCLDTMKKSMADPDAVSCLVLGTENREIYILDPEAFTVLSMVPDVPALLNVTGLFDVDFRIIVACRDSNIYMLKRGISATLPAIELDSLAVGLIRYNKNIVIGCMDQTLRCYTTKGKRLWNLTLPADLTTVELMVHQRRGFKAILVALTNCEVHIYKDKYLVNVITVDDVVTGMKFGWYGREESTLVMLTRGGGLYVKILKRTAVFEERMTAAGPPAAQLQKLNVPKKTKLFVDQTMRERENPIGMHRAFQHDLYRLRLNTARAYVKTLESSLNPVSSSQSEAVKLTAAIQGMGPLFKLNIHLSNTSLTTASIGWFITFQYDETLYRLEKCYIPVPMLVPGLTYNFETSVECLSDKGITGLIKVLLAKKGKSIPVITAVISMPVSEGMMDV